MHRRGQPQQLQIGGPARLVCPALPVSNFPAAQYACKRVSLSCALSFPVPLFIVQDRLDGLWSPSSHYSRKRKFSKKEEIWRESSTHDRHTPNTVSLSVCVCVCVCVSVLYPFCCVDWKLNLACTSLTLFFHHHLELVDADRTVVVGVDLSERVAQLTCQRQH